MKRTLIVGIVIFASVGRILAQAPTQRPLRIRVGSQVLQDRRVHQVAPHYPRKARAAGIQGTVRLEVLVGKNGKVVNMKLISGHPDLANAAMEAVSKWRYKPFVLKGAPLEVLSEVDVNFMLAAK